MTLTKKEKLDGTRDFEFENTIFFCKNSVIRELFAFRVKKWFVRPPFAHKTKQKSRITRKKTKKVFLTLFFGCPPIAFFFAFCFRLSQKRPSLSPLSLSRAKQMAVGFLQAEEDVQSAPSLSRKKTTIVDLFDPHLPETMIEVFFFHCQFLL